MGLSSLGSSSTSSSWGRSARHWLSNMSLSQELSGSLGDLGTFLPLVVALCATIQLDLGTTLLFSGLYNVLSGVAFRIPMCVQPMKTIAAVALSAPGLSLVEVMSAGLFVSGVMVLLGLCGLMDLFDKAVPTSIVRGIQLAVGLQLAQKGLTQALKTSQHAWREWLGVEGLLLGLLTATFLMVTTMPAALSTKQQQQHQQQQQPHDRLQLQQQEEEEVGASSSSCPDERHQLLQDTSEISDVHAAPAGELPQQRSCSMEAAALVLASTQAPASNHSSQHPNASTASHSRYDGCSSTNNRDGSIPSALLVVVVGILLTIVVDPSVLSGLRLGPSKLQVYFPTWQQFKSGALKAGLAQLPLTSLNSVIAVTQLAVQLFPDRVARDGWRWQPGAVAVSVGGMNLLGCWFGAFPCCHGSGGLAAQYKFGARSGTAPMLLGFMKMALALLCGSSLLQLLQHFPQPVLGAMLLTSGLELAASARKECEPRGYVFMLLTATGILGLNNTALGFAAGLGGYIAVLVNEWCCSRGTQLWADSCRWWQRRQRHHNRGSSHV